MRKFLPILVASSLIVSLCSFTACPFRVVVGSANLTSQDFALADFSRVRAEGSFNVDITQAPSYSVKVTVNDNLKDYMQVTRNGDTLILSVRSGYSYRNSTFRAEVTMPGLKELNLSGASRAAVSGFTAREDLKVEVSGASTASFTDIQVRALDAEVSGASTLSGEIDASSFANVRLSGASTAELKGRAEKLSAFASGASSLRLGDFAVGDVIFNVSGASNGMVNASGTLSGKATGASHIIYRGNPTLGDIETSGGSSIGRG